MTGLSVLYASQAIEERGWADVPDRNKVSRLREVYWLRSVSPLDAAKSILEMHLSWKPDRRKLGRRADLPGDEFVYVARMFPRQEASFEWFEVTEIFTTVPPAQVNAAMRAWNGFASQQPVDFDNFLGMLRKERPSRVEQRKAADAVIAQIERKLKKSSYRELMEQYGYGTLVVGLPLWFAVLPEDPWRAENALDDFYTRTSLGLNELKQRALERRGSNTKKDLPMSAFRASTFQIGYDRLTDIFGQGQAPLQACFSRTKRQGSVLPIDVVQSESDHLFGAQSEPGQQQQNGVVAKTFGRAASATVQNLCDLVGGDLPR